MDLLCHERRKEQREHDLDKEQQCFFAEEHAEEISRIRKNGFEHGDQTGICFGHQMSEAGIGHEIAVSVLIEPMGDDEHISRRERCHDKSVTAAGGILFVEEEIHAKADDEQRRIFLDDTYQTGEDISRDIFFLFETPDQPEQQHRKCCIFVEIIEARPDDRKSEKIKEANAEQRQTGEIVVLCDEIQRDDTGTDQECLHHDQRDVIRNDLINRHQKIENIRSMDAEMREQFAAFTGRIGIEMLCKGMECLNEDRHIVICGAEDLVPHDGE